MSAKHGEFHRDWLPSWETYASQHGLDLLGRGAERRARCGIHGGNRPDSLCINVAGPYECKSCGAAGGDVLAYHRAVYGLAFVEAARELGALDEGGEPERANQPAAAHSGPVARVSAPPRDVDTDQLRKIALAARIWRETLPIEPGCFGAAYLLGRHCCLPPSDSDLRRHPDLRLFGFSGPALVCRMSLAADYRVGRGLHLTWLAQGTCGTWRRTARRYLGPKTGAVVRLFSDECVASGLGVGEGIESSLSLAHAMAPTWASMDAANLSAFPVLPGIETLTIAADNDESGTGQAAAEACAERWTDAGRAVHVVLPPRVGVDLNDMARAP